MKQLIIPMSLHPVKSTISHYYNYYKEFFANLKKETGLFL